MTTWAAGGPQSGFTTMDQRENLVHDLHLHSDVCTICSLGSKIRLCSGNGDGTTSHQRPGWKAPSVCGDIELCGKNAGFFTSFFSKSPTTSFCWINDKEQKTVVIYFKSHFWEHWEFYLKSLVTQFSKSGQIYSILICSSWLIWKLIKCKMNCDGKKCASCWLAILDRIILAQDFVILWKNVLPK